MAANIETILRKVQRYNPQADTELIRRAYEYADLKHDGQKRKTGDPYIIHPVAVADILAGLELDTPAIAAGFLHDVIEDCDVTRDELAGEFGDEIADLVDGVTKLKLADFQRRSVDEGKEEGAEGPDLKDAAAMKREARRKKRLETRSSAENLRKILLAMAKDFRVMVIKLADRLHNMRTLQGLAPERQAKVAEETMQIFAPLAHRLGIWQVKWQLEDMAFKYLYPKQYQVVSDKVSRTRREREKDIREVIRKLGEAFESVGLDVEIQGRPKHLWSIYNKMRKQNLDIDQIFDLIAVRVIVGERQDWTTLEEKELAERRAIADCYSALGIVHTVFLPIPGKFDDYIAKKKSNLYQSLHTKVYGPHDDPLEVQIRTWEMHRVAEYGVAAHWAYKERGEGATSGSSDFERKMAFLRKQLFDWQTDSRDSSEFLRSVVSDLFTDQVFVFTPKGDVIDLPVGATPIDFAYRIHTDVGEHCSVARVNGRVVPLSYQFQNGDICQIISRPQASPSLDWLNLVQTSHAKSKIKYYFRRQRYSENVTRGMQMLQAEMDRLSIPHEWLKDQKRMTAVANDLNKPTPDDLYAAVSFGDVPLGVAVNRLKTEADSEADKQEAAKAVGDHPSLFDDGDVVVRRKPTGEAKLAIAPGGVDGVAIRRANCCLPLPGDQVIGYVSRGKGMILHREGCPNVINWRNSEPERLVEADWEPADNARWNTGLIVETLDRMGLLSDVTGLFSENKTFITGISTKSNKAAGVAVLRIDFESPSSEHVYSLISRLHHLQDLIAVYRLGVGAEETAEPSRKP
ncbi:MAG: bifunctional (p)ppGpp synthetase/guanosine-3',5'-bis(diphosphate) 3'-pyrophosphohydrolase [Armatimonadaceae bacterium]